jgi:outer membrane receptor protein involved in Fe transport
MPETAQVSSAGVVLESARARGLSLSVDAWNIDLTGGIQQPLIQTVLTGCYQNGVRSLCDLVHRDPRLGFAIDFVDLSSINLGGTSTSGVDTAVSFDHHARGGGDLHARLDLQSLGSFDRDFGTSVVHGLGVYDLGVHPKRKLSAQASWHHPHGLAAGFNFQFIDSFLECQQDDCNDGMPSRTVESYSKLDVFTSLTFRQLGGEATLTIGVNNVFDRAPPVIFNGAAGNYDEATYDFLGRFTYARLTQSF